MNKTFWAVGLAVVALVGCGGEPEESAPPSDESAPASDTPRDTTNPAVAESDVDTPEPFDLAAATQEEIEAANAGNRLSDVEAADAEEAMEDDAPVEEIVSEGGAVGGFIEVHPRRIGGQKRGLPVWSMDKINDMGDAMLLVAVGAAGARAEIAGFAGAQGKVEGRDYLFVA